MQKFFLFTFLLFSFLGARAQKTDTTVTFTVHGACEMCKSRIENAAKGKGVFSANWSAANHSLQVSFQPDKTSLQKIKSRILAVGHDVDSLKAPDAVYEKLPKCCLYRNGEAAAHEDHGHETGEEHPTPTTTTATTVPDSAKADEPQLKGMVVEADKQGNFIALPGATVQWLNTQIASVTNAQGFFTIKPTPETNLLVISYTGLKSDTITVNHLEELKVIMAERSTGQLSEVVVRARKLTTFVNTTNAIRVQTMSEKELFKAACCNLSESFETNPAVDVSYNDAVTGTKQIQMLGLSGNYTQLTVENMPGPRGLATPMGLGYIPGPWIESIQLTKGVGSVANGFESIAGQINVEKKKALTGNETFFANAYVNDMGKTDFNFNYLTRVSPKWTTALLTHYDFLLNKKVDFNKDGFRDLPTGDQINLHNRWQYRGNKGWEAQLGAGYLKENKQGGQVNFDGHNTNHLYGMQMNTQRYEMYGKLGYVFPGKQYKSVGLQMSTFGFAQQSFFGPTKYDADQKNLYANLIYQSIIGNTNHMFRTGLSLVNDGYEETLANRQFARREVVPGAFFEYTWHMGKKVTWVAGLRGDHNNLFGWYATPRLHVRFAPVPGTTIRVSAGRGQRTANIFADRIGVLASNRVIGLPQNYANAYGLRPEVAWNKGITLDQKFRLFNRDANVSIDFYRNDFTSQVVTDIETPGRVNYYNLNGKSYSNSLQTDLNVSPLKQLELRLAYRYFNVKQTIGGKLLDAPFMAKHRAFANLAYEANKWKFDYTINYIGSKRIPSTQTNPTAYQMISRSPAYFLMNMQITKTVGKMRPMDFYLGSENLGNYFQQKIILAAENPASPYFDASMLWGPVSGRMVYLGWRYKWGSVK